MENVSPLVIVIFGATGDLMARKLIPALYALYKEKAISGNLFIVGVGRREMTQDQFRELMATAVQERLPKEFDLNVWGNLIDGMYYEQGYFEDSALYDRLVATLARFDETMKACVPRFFYLATPPEHYETILTHLKTSKLAEGCGQGTTNFTRILIEKPFGKDLSTAQKLDALLASIFEEKQIYRIDHYLGKETVQNILAFRFANGMFEPTWNAQFIDHIQITLSESLGVASRGAFYDGVGALRDVVQNHMLQMLALIAMEQPRAFDPSYIRDARTRAMQSIIPIDPKKVGQFVVRGQYEGYAKEKQVEPHSQTETYVALKLELDGKRWKGVPFYLRTGKKLGRKVTEISIHYKKPIVCLAKPDPALRDTGDACLFPEKEVLRNVLSIRIQPDDGVYLRLMVKKPGLGMKLTDTTMAFHYAQAFPDFNQPEAYEKLLLDAINGDQTLFARTDGIEVSWQLVTKILEGWSRVAGSYHHVAGHGPGSTGSRGVYSESSGGTRTAPLYTYAPGSMGPKEADALVEKDGRHWFLHEDTVR